MKIFRAVLIVTCLSALIGGCHNDIEVEDLPFEEVLVVRGVLVEGDVLKTLYVGKTTQYQEEYYKDYNNTVDDEFKGWIPDALVEVECDGKRYPMTYRGQGNFGSDSLTIGAGKTYRLHASWNGHRAEAVTTVPMPIAIDSVYVAARTLVMERGEFDEYDVTLEASVRNHASSVFYIRVIQGAPPGYGVNWNAVYRSTNERASDHVTMDITCGFGFLGDPGYLARYSFKYTMYIQSFDEPYYVYKLSENEKLSSQIAWNVSGEAIGMFIGASKQVFKTQFLR